MTKAIQAVEPDKFSLSVKDTVTINSIDDFDNSLAIGSLAKIEPGLRSTRSDGLPSLSRVKDDQSIRLSLEIERYASLQRHIREIHFTESLLTIGRHRRIKQANLDVHAGELRIFNNKYGEEAGKLCAQFCREPLFDHISDQRPDNVSRQILPGASEFSSGAPEANEDIKLETSSDVGTPIDEREHLHISRTLDAQEPLYQSPHDTFFNPDDYRLESSKAIKKKKKGIKPAELANDLLVEDMTIVGQEMSKVFISPLDTSTQDELFDLKNLSSWTRLRSDQIMI